MPLTGKVVQIPPLVSWMEYFSMQGHCSAHSSVPLVSARVVESAAGLPHFSMHKGLSM